MAGFWLVCAPASLGADARSRGCVRLRAQRPRPRCADALQPILTAMDELKEQEIERLAAVYDALHDELKRLLAAPRKDMAAVAAVMERLDAAYLAFKEAHGLHGNNPNT